MKPEVLNAVVLSQLDYCNYCKRNKKTFQQIKNKSSRRAYRNHVSDMNGNLGWVIANYIEDCFHI